jgi:hypothetical protein
MATKRGAVSMVIECVNAYRVTNKDDGGIVVTIDAPGAFADLWLSKLEALVASEEEIAECNSERGGANKPDGV